MSINTLPHKMVALKVIQWDLTDRILRGLSKCFIMQFSWLQCNLMYLSFLAFHNFSLHQFAARSAGAGSPAGRRGGSGGGGATISDSNYTKVLYVMYEATFYWTLHYFWHVHNCNGRDKSCRSYIPSFPLFQSADSERCIHLISQETENWVWKTLEIISLLISSHIEIEDIV